MKGLRMRIVSTKKLQEGMIVGKQVFSDDGRVLLQKDVVLTDQLIQQVKAKMIPCIYIDDEISKEIEITETIDPELKLKALQNVKSIMYSISPLRHKIEKDNKIYISKRTIAEMIDIVAHLLDCLKKNEGSLVRLVEMMGTDMYTYNHSVNVAIIALMIGFEIIEAPNKREKEEKLIALGLGALLHDIGKSLIDPSILNKPDRLTPDEYAIVKKHVTHGYNMIKDNHQINEMKYAGIVKGCVLLHHENLDGSGYPYGWKNEQLKDYVRIMRVADIYTAVISDRVYKNKIPAYQALEQISAMCYRTIDAKVFLALQDRLALYPEGTGVILNTGEKGIVTKNNEERSDRPIVKVIYAPDGKKHRGLKVVDMMRERTYFIDDTTDL